MWAKALNPIVRARKDLGNDRICVLEVSPPGRHKLYVISIYLPHRTCKISSFREHLDMLEHTVQTCQLDGDVVVCGDTNCHLGPEAGCRGWGESTNNAKLLLNMAERQSLHVQDLGETCKGPNYTFSVNNVPTSYIDHCLVSVGIIKDIPSCEIIADTPLNTSDHLQCK